MKRKACIVLNSPGIDGDAIRSSAKQSDIIIVADGAVQHIPDGIEPHIICGDFDSIDRRKAETRFPQSEYVHSLCQETSDLEKCITLAISREIVEVRVVGSLGGRLDHALGVLSVLELYHTRVSISLSDGMMQCIVLSGGEPKYASHVLEASAGDTISLVPRGDGAIVSLQGVEWQLEKERLVAGSRGISNKALGGAVSVQVYDGLVFFFHGSVQSMIGR